MGVADAVAAIAGLDQPKPIVTPERLIAAFCTTQAAPFRAATGPLVDDPKHPGLQVARGFCGYTGGRDPDPLLTGFDEGYDFMAHLQGGGWKALAEKGDWPYVIYLLWRPRPEQEVWAIAEYVEGDFTCWIAPDQQTAREFVTTLRDAP